MLWRWLLVPATVALVAFSPTFAAPATPQHDPWPVPAAEPSARIWTVWMQPSDQPQAAQAFEQAVAMMDGVRGGLVVVDDPHADLAIRWLHELRGGDRLGQHVLGTSRIEIALGDSRCLDGWSPYDAESLARVVAHEIGHGIGLDHDEGTLMSERLPASYVAPCVKRGSVDLMPLQSLTIAAQLGGDGQVGFRAVSSGMLDACVTPGGDAGMAGWGCHRSEHPAADVALPAGTYSVVLRCVSLLGCSVDHEVVTRTATAQG